MIHKDITSLIEAFAPIQWQESYDNCGYQVGSPLAECTGVLLAMDCTEAVVDEACQRGLNLIITHHPLLFRPLKRVTGASLQEKLVIKAIQNGITIYAAHTNLDKSRQGVSFALGEMLELKNMKILAPEGDDYRKLVYFAPPASIELINKRLFEAGAGSYGRYDSCSFEVEGLGGFLPLDGSNPSIGNVNKYYKDKEVRVELVFPTWKERKVINALLDAHPYEVPAYDVIKVENSYGDYGLGVVGDLATAMPALDFLLFCKEKLHLEVIKHNSYPAKNIQKIALCGGSGASLVSAALGVGADAYISGEIGYHPFDSYQNELLLAEFGHFESEFLIIKRLNAIIQEKISNFAVRIAQSGNPVKYI